MAATDPKTTITTIIVDHLGNIKKDNGADNASVGILWESGPETLKRLFTTAAYDVVITIGEPRSRSARPVQDVPMHFYMDYPVTVTTVNTPILGLPFTCTAAEMQYKVTYALRAAIRVHAQSLPAGVPAFTMKLIEDSAIHKRIGGLDVWQATHYVRYETDYG